MATCSLLYLFPIRKADLARRLGWHVPQVDRMFDLTHASRFDQIEAAARALDLSVEVRVSRRDAA
jgi:antitoxin HicB